MGDAVNNPKHYHSHPSGVACVELNRLFSGSLAAAIKYAWRLGQKGDAIEDAEKCLWYLTDANASDPFWANHIARFASEAEVRVWIEKVVSAEPRDTILHEILVGLQRDRSLVLIRSLCRRIVNDMKTRMGVG